jgi:hypothetical protein
VGSIALQPLFDLSLEMAVGDVVETDAEAETDAGAFNNGRAAQAKHITAESELKSSFPLLERLS